jgi:hypothetical protein
MRNASLVLRPLSLCLAASAVLATGCANLATTATSISPLGGDTVVSGHLHGGQQAVSGADVRLYAAGTTGYGSAGTLYASTTSASDGYGSFQFTQKAGVGSSQSGTSVYSCPASGNPQMYILARGGATQGTGNGTNAAAAFIIALGPCSGIASSFSDMNEATTVATMASLTQYFSPANANSDGLNHLGSPSTTQATTAFANAVGNIANLVNVANGTVNTTTTLTGTPTGAPAAVSVTVTPEISKIGTLADIIAACVNTTSSASPACTTLFTNAVPPAPALTSQPAVNFGTATDTLQALYYMLANPASGGATAMNNLYALQTASAPFLPNEGSVPTDWTVGLRYSSTSACAASTANFLLYAYHLAADAAGDVWAVSNATGGNLFELGPNGAPLTCNLGATVSKSESMAIDANGNVWMGGIANTNLYKYVPSSGSYTTWPTGESTGSQFITIDGSGNVAVSSYAGSAVYSFANGANIPVPFTASQISATVGTEPYFIGADTAGRLFSTDSGTSGFLYDIYPSTATADATYLNGYETANVGSTTSTTNGYGVAAGLAGSVATLSGNNSTSTVSNTLSILAPGATAGTATVSSTSAQYAGGLAGPRELAIDGAGNIWSVNSTAAKTNYISGSSSGLYALTEFSATGAALSPTGSSTSTTTINGGFQKDASVLPNAGRGISIDPSGNVWVGSNSSTGTGITVLLGAAVPVVTPVSSALAAGAASTNAVQKP